MKARREFVVIQNWGTSPWLSALKRIYVAPSGETEIAILESLDASWPLRWAHHDARHQRLASSPAWPHLGQRPVSVLILTQLTMQSAGDA